MTDLPCHNDAAYVLGALAPGERRAYEAHLPGCPDCRASLADLSGIPGALRKVPADLAFSMLAPAAGPEADLAGAPEDPGEPAEEEPPGAAGDSYPVGPVSPWPLLRSPGRQQRPPWWW